MYIMNTIIQGMNAFTGLDRWSIIGLTDQWVHEKITQ